MCKKAWIGILTATLLASSPARGANRLVNRFTVSSLAISLEEPSFAEGSAAGPGDSVPKNPRVKNEGTASAWVFLEVISPLRSLCYLSASEEIGPEETEVFSYETQGDWVMVGEPRQTSEGVVRLYAYPHVLSPGAQTEPLFTSLQTLPYIEEDSAAQLNVGLRALAIQSEGVSGSAEEIYEQYLAHAGES